MPGRQAKILSNQQVQELLCFADTTRNPNRNRLMILLSIKAGLRAGEIAKLTWEMLIDPEGNLTTTIELRDFAAKKRSGRRIPIAPISARRFARLEGSS
jgi:integrase